MKGERNSSRVSAAMRQREQQEKRFLKCFDGDGYDDIIIIVATSRKGEWEIEIRLQSGCIRRRNNKKK
jgi:hypothetical protein